MNTDILEGVCEIGQSVRNLWRGVWGSSSQKFWNLRYSQMNSEAFWGRNTMLWYSKFYLIFQTLSNLLFRGKECMEGGMHPLCPPLDQPLLLMTLIKTKYTKPKYKCWSSHRILAWQVCQTRRHPPPSQTFLHWRFWCTGVNFVFRHITACQTNTTRQKVKVGNTKLLQN